MGLYYFVDNGAIPLVEQFGFSEKAIGMTVVAIGTSLPELFVTLMALSKREIGISSVSYTHLTLPTTPYV